MSALRLCESGAAFASNHCLDAVRRSTECQSEKAAELPVASIQGAHHPVRRRRLWQADQLPYGELAALAGNRAKDGGQRLLSLLRRACSSQSRCHVPVWHRHHRSRPVLLLQAQLASLSHIAGWNFTDSSSRAVIVPACWLSVA